MVGIDKLGDELRSHHYKEEQHFYDSHCVVDGMPVPHCFSD